MQQRECSENSEITILANALLKFKDYLRIEKTIKNFEGFHTIELWLPMGSGNNLHGQLIAHIQEGLNNET